MRSLRALAVRLGCPPTVDYMFEHVTIDSREARQGSLFFALSGRNTDGHRFVADVLGDGGAAVVSRDGFTGPILEVDSVEEALLEAGSWARESMEFPVVAVTGSSGKTTTRKMIAAALSREYVTWETQGNLNNHLGLPLTLLNTPEKTEFLVLEMGMNHPGEILRLGWAARPLHAVVTNVGRAHMEFFHSIEDVARAKSELLQTTAPGGIALIPAGEEILAGAAMERELEIVTHGEGGDCWLENGKAMPWGIDLKLKYMGEHNMANALCAIAFADHMGVEPADAAEALALISPSPGRGENLHIDDRTIIDESYNANPDSTAACLRAVSSSLPEPRLALLGDMLEQGGRADEFHRDVLMLAEELGFSIKILVGNHYKTAARELEAKGCINAADWKDALEILRRTALPGSSVLVKGSNSVGLSKLVEILKREGF